MNLGEHIDRRAALKVEKAAAQAVVDSIEDQIKETERAIMGLMFDADLRMASGNIAKVVIKEDIQPSVNDWTKLHEYIRDHNAFYLLQRRVSATAFREALQAGETIDGVVGVPVKSLSVTSI